MKFTVSKILYTTMEKDGSALISFNEVAKPTLEVYKMLISEILGGKRFVLTNDGTCYVEGREKADGVFVADLYHTGYDFCLVSVSVYPPERDCDHVRSVSNMEGIMRLQKIRDGVLTEDIHETLAFIGDTGRVIAWLWLMHKGYVETYA